MTVYLVYTIVPTGWHYPYSFTDISLAFKYAQQEFGDTIGGECKIEDNIKPDEHEATQDCLKILRRLSSEKQIDKCIEVWEVVEKEQHYSTFYKEGYNRGFYNAFRELSEKLIQSNNERKERDKKILDLIGIFSEAAEKLKKVDEK